MDKKQVISDITRVVNGSSCLQEACERLDDYIKAVSMLDILNKWVQVNDPRPAAYVKASGDREEEGTTGGGGTFGGGGASGRW